MEGNQKKFEPLFFEKLICFIFSNVRHEQEIRNFRI